MRAIGQPPQRPSEPAYGATAPCGRRYTGNRLFGKQHEPRSPGPVPAAAAALGKAHARRLREIYRSAGWPCQDPLEIELLAAGLLDRVRAPSGHESLRVTDAGVQLLASTLAGNRAAFSAHEALVERVAQEMGRAGRIAWRGLALRAQVPAEDSAQPLRWCVARPDVFSIRNTSVATYVDPIVHEVKVRRADLLGDLRQGAKRRAYVDLGECWYVLGCDAKGPLHRRARRSAGRVRRAGAGKGQARRRSRRATALTQWPAVRRVDGAGESHAGRRPRRGRSGDAGLAAPRTATRPPGVRSWPDFRARVS